MHRPNAQTRAVLAALALTACSIPGPGPTALSRIAVGVSPVTGKYVVSVAGCPDWTRSSREDFSNRASSNFGCADALNFTAQLAEPLDAVRGRGTGAQDAGVAASAVDRYRAGKVKPLRAAAPDTGGAANGPAGAQ